MINNHPYCFLSSPASFLPTPMPMGATVTAPPPAVSDPPLSPSRHPVSLDMPKSPSGVVRVDSMVPSKRPSGVLHAWGSLLSLPFSVIGTSKSYGTDFGCGLCNRNLPCHDTFVRLCLASAMIIFMAVVSL